MLKLKKEFIVLCMASSPLLIASAFFFSKDVIAVGGFFITIYILLCYLFYRNYKKPKVKSSPRYFSLVKYDDSHYNEPYRGKGPFKYNHTYLFMGEIANMPEHCVVVDTKTNEIFSGYHTDTFVELTEDEV